MLKKIGISLLATMMLSSVALAFDNCPVSDWDIKQGSKQEERKVLKFDKEVVKKILIEEDGYSNIAADRLINMYSSKFDIKLQSLLDAYIHDRMISDDFNVEGVTLKIIMEKRRYNFWNALSTMNILIVEPEMASELLEMSPGRWEY